MLRNLVLATVLFGSTSYAEASPAKAEAKFVARVEQGCLDASEDLSTEASVAVDPFGSQSYGLAIVTGQASDGLTASTVCVFEKRTKAIEIGGELDVMVTSR